ncbi:MAG TPA: hypothetical protein VFP58_03405 [Candidatus Eisenbacteria bacterium]|nr:hypothetical protein [Candidatus Eisenbacteria bacterium]
MKTLLALAAALAFASPAFAQEGTTSAPATTPPPATADKPADNMEMLRDKLRADKKLIVAEAMKLTEKEGAAFWPVYETYQKELTALNDRTMKLIKDYATSYGAMTDPAAKGIMDSFLAIEKDRIQLMTSYTPKFRKVLPEVKVARYYQVENKIRAVVNYELAQEIPLAN